LRSANPGDEEDVPGFEFNQFEPGLRDHRRQFISRISEKPAFEPEDGAEQPAGICCLLDALDPLVPSPFPWQKCHPDRRCPWHKASQRYLRFSVPELTFRYSACFLISHGGTERTEKEFHVIRCRRVFSPCALCLRVRCTPFTNGILRATEQESNAAFRHANRTIKAPKGSCNSS